MNAGARWLVAAVVVLSVAACAQTPERGGGAVGTGVVTLLHTNDLHGHLEPWTGWEGELAGQRAGGLARLATLVERVRREVGAERVLLLDAGDTLGDTQLAARTQGRAVIEAMNLMRYDAMVVGNHEPDFGMQVLRERAAEARFPMLAANLFDAQGGRIVAGTLVREVGGVRVGILGLAYPNTPLTTAPSNVQGVRFAAAARIARTEVPRLREAGAQIVIALTHLGLSADQALAEAVPDIDVIVGGHSHNRMREPLRAGRTLIVHAGAHGSDLGRLDLTVREGRIVEHRRTLIPVVGDIEAHAEVARAVARQRAPHEAAMTAPVARTAALIERAQTLSGNTAEPRERQSPADSLFADAVREATGAQIAFLPGVGYGVALQPGTVPAHALKNLIPHDSRIWTMTLTGAQIREVLEQAVENVTTHDPTKKVGGMIQVSGLRFAYQPDAARGQRVREVVVGAGALDPAARYRVATNALLANGGHAQSTFLHGEARAEGASQYETVREWLGQRPGVKAPEDVRMRRLGAGG